MLGQLVAGRGKGRGGIAGTADSDAAIISGLETELK